MPHKIIYNRILPECGASQAYHLATGRVNGRDLSVEEAIELGRRSIFHATFRDAMSGGCVSGTDPLFSLLILAAVDPYSMSD